MYSVEDLKGEKVDGRFYTEELQETAIPHYKRIEKVVSKKTIDKKKYVTVSYFGWPEKFNETMLENEYKKLK
jgi:hypothetical protein